MSTETDSTELAAFIGAWEGPYGGVPPWDAIRPEFFDDAFDLAIAESEAEIEAIANNSEPPSFDNTIVALERAGKTLQRVAAMFGVHAGNLNVGPIPDLQRSVWPKLAAYQDRVTQHEGLFARIAHVYEQASASEGGGSGGADLDDDQQRLLDDRYTDFVRRGAKLSAADKERLSAVNQELATVYTDFGQNVLHDENEIVTWVDDESRLDGLPATFVDSLASAAADRGRPGSWAVLNTRSSMDPVLRYATDRGLREEVWRTYYSRGDHDGEHNNKPLISRILKLRAERAALLGYETHAHWRLEVAMAKTPETAMDLMMTVWDKARAQAEAEVADMERLAGMNIEPWDHRFYAEQVRKDRYDLDFNDVKPYLQLQNLVDAMLWCAGELYGLQFDQVDDVPAFHPDVTVYRVTGADGGLVGLWYLDPYAREGKRSGAWMTSYRVQENIDGPVSTLVSNNSNFIKAAEGGSPEGAVPVLVAWDDAVTLFHEFGHALHGLLSDVRYPGQSGTAVARDYVEFPSQLNEHWLMTDEVLQRFCLHHETGEPIPPELVDRIKRAETFNQGFDTVEYLSAAIVDMQLHLAGDADIDPEAFERDALAELDMPPQIVMRHRMPHFAHVFSGDGYSAGYYSYLWSDALTADAAEAFTEAGGFFDAEVADRLRSSVLSVGDTVDPAEGFRAFRGRDVDTDALLRKRGLANASGGRG